MENYTDYVISIGKRLIRCKMVLKIQVKHAIYLITDGTEDYIDQYNNLPNTHPNFTARASQPCEGGFIVYGDLWEDKDDV